VGGTKKKDWGDASNGVLRAADVPSRLRQTSQTLRLRQTRHPDSRLTFSPFLAVDTLVQLR
jgi:hypothetical protein